MVQISNMQFLIIGKSFHAWYVIVCQEQLLQSL